MNMANYAELEKAATYLVQSLADVMAAAGPTFAGVREELDRLVNSDRLLDADYLKRSAYNLANAASDLSGGVQSPPEVRDEAMELYHFRCSAGMRMDDVLGNMFLNMINHFVSIRPGSYGAEVEDLMHLLNSDSKCEDVFRGFLDLVVQIREDLWEERTKAFKHVGEILRSLEKTEKDFVGSLNTSHAYIERNEGSFTTAMEDGLKEIGALVEPGGRRPADLDSMFQRVSAKVDTLRQRLKEKKEADQGRLAALGEERAKAQERLARTNEEYTSFSRQSHEMLQEIENLRAASLKDPLTDVFNRRAYDGQIARTLADFAEGHLKTVSLIVFDIDNFRDFNNTYGHLAGDRILTYVAKLTRGSLRNDDLIYRYGGDEFVVLMPGATITSAVGVAEKIRRNINSVEFKVSVSSEKLQVTLSMGVAEIKPEDTAETFFARADKAMYQSKTGGRNRVNYL